MANANKIPDFAKMASDLKKDAQRYASSESVKFFKESFINEGFTDSSFTPWKKTNNPMMGKRTLYKNGTLMQSVRKKEETPQRIVIESDLPYSEIHNNGGFIIVTAKMKKFFWAKYIEFAGIKKDDTGKTNWNDWTNIKTNKKGDRASLSSKNKTISSKAKFFKAMALKPVGSKIKIDKTQFMGNSKIMMSSFETWWIGNIDVVFKQNLNSK